MPCADGKDTAMTTPTDPIYEWNRRAWAAGRADESRLRPGHKWDRLDYWANRAEQTAERDWQRFLRSPEYRAHEAAVAEHVRTHGTDCAPCIRDDWDYMLAHRATHPGTPYCPSCVRHCPECPPRA